MPGSQRKYALIKQRLTHFSVAVMCHVLEIHRTSLYAWRAGPISQRAKENAKLFVQIKQYWLESGCINVYSNITKVMRDGGFSAAKFECAD